MGRKMNSMHRLFYNGKNNGALLVVGNNLRCLVLFLHFPSDLPGICPSLKLFFDSFSRRLAWLLSSSAHDVMDYIRRREKEWKTIYARSKKQAAPSVCSILSYSIESVNSSSSSLLSKSGVPFPSFLPAVTEPEPNVTSQELKREVAFSKRSVLDVFKAGQWCEKSNSDLGPPLSVREWEKEREREKHACMHAHSWPARSTSF